MIQVSEVFIWISASCYPHFITVQLLSHPLVFFTVDMANSWTIYSRTSIIRISRLSGLFLWFQFGHEYLLITIKIRSHIIFKTIALKSAVKCLGFCFERAKAGLARFVTNEEHSK